MNTSLAIAAADDEVDMRDFYAKILVFLGHRVVGVAKTGLELVAICGRCRPDLIITDVTMPEMDGARAVAEICRIEPLPVVLVSAMPDAARGRSQSEYVMAYLVKPIGRKDLQTTIGTAMRRFDACRQLRQEAPAGIQADGDRDVFEQAAEWLVRTAGIDKHDAYSRLQSIASERRLRLADVARAVLAGEVGAGGNRRS